MTEKYKRGDHGASLNSSAHSMLGFHLRNLQNKPTLPWRQPANNVNEKTANGYEG